MESARWEDPEIPQPRGREYKFFNEDIKFNPTSEVHKFPPSLDSTYVPPPEQELTVSETDSPNKILLAILTMVSIQTLLVFVFFLVFLLRGL
jgi:hypothetical protein